MSYKPKRGTIALEDAEIVDHQAFAGQQFILRVRAPSAARRATPGTFAHISVDPAVPLRRPLSIMTGENVVKKRSDAFLSTINLNRGLTFI